MKKRLVLATILLLALSGCGSSEEYLIGRVVKLPDGRSVTCVTSSLDSRSGVSCDWETAK